MINDKESLRLYLDEDRKALGISRVYPSFFGMEIWKFQIALRHYEYHINTHKSFIVGKIWKYLYHYYKLKLGFDIPPNTCDYGLNIHHFGCIVINPKVKIGKYCCIQQCVNIGQNYSPENVPTIGDNVYIGPGAKIFGKIKIANGTAIGAGAIVNKSVIAENKIVVGNPAIIMGDRKEGLI